MRPTRSGYQCATGGDACPGHRSKWLHCVPSDEVLIAACRASLNEFDVPHTCGLETRMYFQGEPHKHDGATCVDWAHCTRTSDQQSANGGPSDPAGPVN